jgi:hypothetical protein
MEEQIRQIVYQAYKDRDPKVKSREFWLRMHPWYWIHLAIFRFINWTGRYDHPEWTRFFYNKLGHKFGGDWA